MRYLPGVSKSLAVLMISAGLATSANANTLLTDLTSLQVGNFADRMWMVSDQAADELQLKCTDCKTQVLLNVRLGSREEFGGLGPEAAKKAKAKCNRSLDQLLQCDTIEGIEFNGISGLTATKKVLEDFYISSFILGDDKTLVKMTTKASSKLEADKISREFFETIKTEVIVK
ncbi:MAG: hypothetical protein QNJ29_15210 [Rhizobiaceae bacterium]|nr:hypothetical protein [Rhizobiaceae bacterium]